MIYISSYMLNIFHMAWFVKVAAYFIQNMNKPMSGVFFISVDGVWGTALYDVKFIYL